VKPFVSQLRKWIKANKSGRGKTNGESVPIIITCNESKSVAPQAAVAPSPSPSPSPSSQKAKKGKKANGKDKKDKSPNRAHSNGRNNNTSNNNDHLHIAKDTGGAAGTGANAVRLFDGTSPAGVLQGKGWSPEEMFATNARLGVTSTVVEEPLVYPDNADELFAKFLGPNHPHLRSPKFKASTPNHSYNNNNNNGHGRSSSAMTVPTSKTHHRASQSVQIDRRVSPPQQRSQSVTPQVIIAPIAQQPATPLWGNIPRPPPLGLDDQPGMPVPPVTARTSPGLVPQRSPAASPTNSMTLPLARPVVVPVTTSSHVPASVSSVSIMSYPPMPSNAPLASSLLAPRPVQPVVVPSPALLTIPPPSLSINGGMMSTGISPRQPASSPPATLLNFRFDAASILDALSSPLSSQSPVLRASPPSMPIVPGVAV
jgi:hypothetical protein